MSLPLLIRPMLPAERNMILKAWKQDLWDARPSWGRGLHSEEWWTLVNYTVDEVTFPSAQSLVVCHEHEPMVPLCWAVTREGRFLHMHAVAAVHAEPELAARLEQILHERQPVRVAVDFNPFHELERVRRRPS